MTQQRIRRVAILAIVAAAAATTVSSTLRGSTFVPVRDRRIAVIQPADMATGYFSVRGYLESIPQSAFALIMSTISVCAAAGVERSSECPIKHKIGMFDAQLIIRNRPPDNSRNCILRIILE